MNSKLAITFFCFLFLFVAEITSAQTQKLDSLKALMDTANDTAQVNALRWMGKYSRSIDKQKAVDYGVQSLERSRKIGFKLGEIKGLYDLGLTHGITGSYLESLDYLKQCLTLSKEENNYEYMKMIYNGLGIVYKEIGDYITSKDYYLKSIKLVDSLDLPYNISSAYSNLGILYDLMGEQDKAVQSYQKALEVYKGPDKKHLENNVLHNLAIIDKHNKDYESALSKYLKVVEYNEKQDDKVVLAAAYLNIANCYIELKKWHLAEGNLEKAMALAQQLSLRQLIPSIYLSMSNLMLQQKRYKEALVFSKKNLDILDDSGFQLKKEGHEIAYEIHEASGNFTEAIYHLNKTMAYKDSILNETKVKEIQNLQIQHDVYLKDKEIKENELQLALLNTKVSLNNRRMIYLTIIILLLLLSASLLYVRYKNNKKSNILLREKNELISQQKETIENINTELEKRMLRAQLNPHFIFNSLNAIQHLINKNDRINALKYLSKFSKLLRQVLESSINISLILKEEIELLKIYVELERFRFDDSFEYAFEVDENINIHQQEIPMLLVQPYIENAIVHGLMPKEGEKRLKIIFKDKEEYIECTIEDNGIGLNCRPKKENANEPSRGMSITEKRINALKRFSNQQLIKIENLKHAFQTGTRVTILVPKD